MKMKNIVAFAAFALGAFAMPFAAQAEVTGGDIYSVDLSTRGGGLIPTPGTTLTLGEAVTIRIRLINRLDGDGNPVPWEFVPTSTLAGADPQTSVFSPQLGLMLGGQEVFADYLGAEQTAVGSPKRNAFTDLYFQYRVKSGDLALPARFESMAGKAVGGDDDATDYALHFCNYLGSYWKLNNRNGQTCAFHFCDPAPSPDPDPSYEAGTPQRFITGTGLGINVKTIDFDTTYFKDPSSPGVDDGVWRQLYVGLTTALPSTPAVKVAGVEADVDATMYIWVENDDPDDPVAQVLTSDSPEWIETPGKDDGRWVIKKPVARKTQGTTFQLMGKKEGTVKVRMSASRELSYDKAGDVIADWVERNVSVVPPPDPYVMIEVLDPTTSEALPKSTVQLTADYENPAAMLRLTLLQEPSQPLKVTLVPELDDGDIFEDGLLGLSLTTEDSPWLNEDLEFTVKPGDPLTQPIYVYAKGATSKLSSKGVKFTVFTEGAPEYDGESGKHSCKLLVKPMNPSLVKPAAGDAITDAMAGKNYSLDIAISDARKYMVDAVEDEPYTVYFKVEALGTEGEWDSDDAVFLNDADTGEATISVPFDIEGECQLLLYVLSPSGKKSPTTTIPVTVAAPKRATVTLDRESGVYAEGDTAYVNFHLTQKYKNELYAFLVPQDDDTKAKFETDISSEVPGAIGLYFGPNETDSKVPAEIHVLDGKATGRFQVFMCTTKNYSKTKSGGYIGDVFTISVTNVVPSISQVSMGGQDLAVTDPEKRMRAVAQNVEKVFRISGLFEPGQLDLEATGEDAFLTEWKFGTKDWEKVWGNPNLATTCITNKFMSPGDQEVKVRCQDKDMRKLGKWSEEFTFTVPVLDIPKVVITPIQGRKQYYEDETGSDFAFNVELTAAPDLAGTERLGVELKVKVLGDGTKYSTDDLLLSKYAVEFAGGVSKGPSFFLKQLDGTAESAASGFLITATVTNAVVDTEGKTWDDGEIEVYIINRAPAILNPSEKLDAEGKAIATVTTIGAENTLAWSLKDVVADKKAMTVTWETSEGERVIYHQGEGTDTETDIYRDDVMSGKHVFKFTSAGEKSITLTAEDKDGESTSRTFYYKIEASKSLTIVPHGPASGFGTANSKRYRAAPGLGEGRVWAKNLASLEEFTSLYNCGIANTWNVFAYGYKVGDIDDGVNLHKVDGTLGYYTNRDTPINGDGNPLAGGTPFAYAAPKDRNGQEVDSFLYAWLQISTKGGEGAGSSPTDEIFGSAVQPEYTEVKDSGIMVVLPEKSGGSSDKDNSSGTYPDTTLEAIFSREYLASDNMGDINQDGIPDIYIDKYGLGVVDTASGQMSGDDLKPVTSENNGNTDEDYIPATYVSKYGSLMPDLKETWVTYGTPFSAVTEIRGYHEGLNDAPAQVGITGVKPDRIYAVDGAYDPKKCTISELEFIAFTNWCGRQEAPLDPADKANWAKWSPERPTDPTVADTDDDGMPDGYEYFFWYRAHVGFIDGDGTYRRMEGRRFVPTDPANPEIISADDIAELMDPIVAGDKSTLNTRDTDNDGLEDLVEFERGTNPFDFDTDGDGLPDGYEIEITKTDPLLYATDGITPDGELNPDHDFKAETEMPLNWVDLVDAETPGATNRFWSAEKFAFTNVVSGEAGEVTNRQVLANGKLVDAWRYGSGDPDAPWALGGASETTSVTGGAWTVVADGAEKVKVLHYQVFMKDGFDPRVGWNDPLPAKEGHIITTTPFTHLDELLVMSFYYRNGGVAAGELVPMLGKNARKWVDIWTDTCTNPLEADTDKDGMPDGWELYIQMGSGKGEKPEKACGPGPDCIYSPLYDFAKVTKDEERDPDKDKLDFVEEYAGIESTGRYSPTCPTIQLTPDQERWQNKWWCTNPYNKDTDGDGIDDGAEFTFIWDGAKRKAAIDDEGCVEGGGLNPLSWDTDLDGLPDPFELEFRGKGDWIADAAAAAPASTNATTNATATVSAAGKWNDLGMNGTAEDSRKDYDHDGLANWQEYMTSSMRCWRYDDTVSPWGDGVFDPIDNKYFSLCVNAFEQDAWKKPPAVKVYNHYYMFKDGYYHDLAKNTPNRFTAPDPAGSPPLYFVTYNDGSAICPQKYICTSPLEADTDHDGMDDYYELFHGLNPLLGESGISSTTVPCDIVFDAYLKPNDKPPWFAEANYWIEDAPKHLTRPETPLRNTGLSAGSAYDFFQFPWLGGLARADVDGDNIRNQDESIMPRVQAASTYLHTDPTPLWMTDSSYASSLVGRYYYMAASGEDITKRWMGAYALRTMFSYEENEGFDSDHDFLGDFEETQGKTKTASDPQWHDSPLRRQAMWLNGEDAFLQTALPEFESAPNSSGVATVGQNYLYFTVECWAKPDGETLGREQTLVERSVYTGKAGPADAKYLRKNFLIGIRNGRWYAKFDSPGVDEAQSVEITNGPEATTNWTHVAFTYGPANDDQNDPSQPMRPRLYVNGVRYNGDPTKIKPEHGVSALILSKVNEELGRSEWARPLLGPTVSFTVGASAETLNGVVFDMDFRAGLLYGPTTLADYGRFYRGYVDEVRIWDGARKADAIRHDYEQRVRYTDEMALANREEFHKKWLAGGTRSPESSEDLPARLMHHWSFDHIAGAVEPTDLMDVPAGFRTGEDVTDGMAVWARPKDWKNAWWSSVLVRSTVYSDTAWVPWINDTVCHLPRYDRTTVDSVYWSSDYAGYLSALGAGYAQFYFPRHGEVPSRWVQMCCETTPLSQDARYNLVSTNETLAADYKFTMFDRQTAGFDLLPMGGAYPRRISAAEGGMWDDQGAADAWAESGSDADHNGLPEWWERYARANYAKGLSPWEPFAWDTDVVCEGFKMKAWQAYMRDLARGMLPDGERHDEFIDTRDVDGDGIPDWWEDLYSIDTHSVADALADPDGDGLGNYVEYLITEKFKYAQLDPNEAKSDGVCVDYFRRVGDLYLGEIFTDHDQVNDVWENNHADSADFYAYDPSRDDDGDGWSNFAEQKAGTDPGLVTSTGIDDYTLANYPVPCIRAKVSWNGKKVITAPVVIKAWSERRDAGMTGDPDAVWTLAGSAKGGEKDAEQKAAADSGEQKAGAIMGASSKYLGIKPDGTRTLTLGPGAIAQNSVKIFYKDLSYCKAVIIGNEIVPTEIGDESAAQWYYVAHDRGGKLYTTGGIFAGEQEVGTVDYDTGAVTIDFNADYMTGIMLGDAGTTDGDENPTYDLLNLDQSYVLVTWDSNVTAGSLNRTLYLSDADDAGDGEHGFGHVREGLNSFIAFADTVNENGQYDPGEPYGFVRGIDVGWSGAEFEIELTETSPVFARVNVFGGASGGSSGGGDSATDVSDRQVLWGTSCTDTPGSSTASNDTWGVSANAYDHVRIVPYMVAGVYTDGEGSNSFVHAVDYVENRVVAEFDVRKDTKPYITEADFIRDGAFDIDWDGFSTSAFANNSRLTSAVGEVTAVKYRVIFGNEGPIGAESNLDASSPGVSSFHTLIERRFERTADRTKPTGLSVDGVVCGAQPLFGWRLDEPTDVQVYANPNTGVTSYVEPAARYGCSYTAFQIQVADRDGNVVYDSGVVRAPVRDADGFFRWTPTDLYAGDQTALGKVFAATGNWQWRVAMYNSKFKPNVRETMNGWSAWQPFSTSVGTGNTLGDLAHETIPVSVKYTGPVKVLDGCEDLAKTEGTVRLQAFVSPDFSGEPVAQGFIADKASLTNVADTAANGRLIGLMPGEYYLRAYVDTNGNLMKDDWESWGAAAEAVTVGPGIKVPDIRIYIEDADTDQDWIPDAWEMQVNGSLDVDNVYVLPDGQIKFKLIYPETKKAAKTSLKSAAAPVTFFQNLNAVRFILTSEATDSDGDALADILAATQSKAVPGTVAITSLALDANKGEAVLTVTGETEKTEAAELLDAIYVFPDQPLTLNVYRKNSLAEKDWTLVKENIPVILGSGTEEEVRVSLGDEIDPTSGFYMIKVVQ